MAIPPIQLYIHIPYCLHKCPYCDFNSHVREGIPWADYGRALTMELEYWANQPQYQGRQFSSLFFGGGTPSLAPPSLIATVIDSASNYFGITSSAEVTLEANPGALDTRNFSDYRKSGVNRISIGAQSFIEAELHWLERIHNGTDVFLAYDQARRAGFDNINLDLMYALPSQSIETWTTTLDQAIQLGPEHLSCYQLTVEPHTLLANRHATNPYSLPNEELALQFLWMTRERLSSSGFNAYEVSNFAQPDRHCRHNDGYWLYHDYIGIGAGAAGKSDMQDNKTEKMGAGVRRYANIRSPENYMRHVFDRGESVGSEEQLDCRKSAAEAIWMGLRRQKGFDRHWFNERFGEEALTLFSLDLQKWIQSGVIQVTEDTIQLSKEGVAFADSVATDLF